jgi:integrase
MTIRGVYRRAKSPNWWIDYMGPLPDGSWGRIRESVKTTDFDKAKRLLDRRRRAVANHRDGIRRFQGPAQERVTVGEILDNLERHYETRKLKSLRSVKARRAHIRRAFGFRRAAQVTRTVIDNYIAARRAEKIKNKKGKVLKNKDGEDRYTAEATIDRETELIHRALTLGQEDGLVAYVPRVTHLVKGHANAKQGFVERADFIALLVQLPSQVLRDVVTFAYWTGMRKGEILSLNWDGYDHATKTITLQAARAKTGHGRVIRCSQNPELVALLDRRLAARRLDSPLIFHNGEGRHVGNFSTTWGRALRNAEVAFAFHDLRRTAIRNMVRAGVPERVAMEISGHRTRAIFDRYNIVSGKDLDDAMAKRAVYEAEISKAKTRANGSKEPVTFPSPTPSPRR